MTTASAPGKIILFGEHAVVYGRPAIAVPVRHVRAVAQVESVEDQPAGMIWIESRLIGLSTWIDSLAAEDPVRRIVELSLDEVGASTSPALKITIHSTIPVAGGLGSGAAVSVAVARALSQHLGKPLPDDRVSALAFEVEKIHHGHPSGIDNTVISFDRAVCYRLGQPPEPFSVAKPLSFLVGDTGLRSSTASVVGGVRIRWERDRQTYEAIFDSIGLTVDRAREAIVQGDLQRLGPLMDHNQELLEAMGVSGPELQRLVWAARRAGARGAKLSGAGAGGNMIALVEDASADAVAAALREAGAVSVFLTVLS
jgi:mevalonate kinase